MTFNLKNIVQDIYPKDICCFSAGSFGAICKNGSWPNFTNNLLLHKQNANNKPTSFIVIDTKIVLIGYSIHI